MTSARRKIKSKRNEWQGKEKGAPVPGPAYDPEKSEIGLLFLDSGAHSLYTRELMDKGHKEGYAFYDSDAFWHYVDEYAAFVKANEYAIDYYASVDAIFNPEKSWEVLKYLENEHGLHPIPVIHWGTDIKWLKKHVEAGYEYIGLGGLGQEVSKRQYFEWADKVYGYLCPSPSYLPIVKTHGFAMTSYELMFRYPWFSTDSASWVKSGAFGKINMPRKKNGKFDFSREPIAVDVSYTATKIGRRSRHHVLAFSKAERAVVEEWLEYIGIPFGSVTEDNKVKEWGVSSYHSARKIANLRFIQEFLKAIPPWPWPFAIRSKASFF
jgi:hypothetical protein